MFSPTAWQTLHDQGLLSPTGECRTFDAAANGYARGEAINMIYVKRLSNALKDGDNIRAVIRGSAVNCDGRTQGMTMPSATAQAELIRHTYELAGITELSKTAFVECHGTGTPVGDPIETGAVASCFGNDGLIITGVSFCRAQCVASSRMKILISDMNIGQAQCRPCRRCCRNYKCNQVCSSARTQSSATKHQFRQA